MKFTVDPWDPAYGSSLESEMQQSEATVVTDLEVADADWGARAPGPDVRPPDAIVFVDGVRRLEARTWIDDGKGDAWPGIFASYAAGAVRCDGRAQLVAATVGRGVYSPAPALGDVETQHGRFTAHTTADASPEALTYAVHEDMSECEVRIAEDARRNGDELILLDGPLRKRGHIHDAVGVVKSHYVRYLPPELDRVVGALHAGERTPLFRVDAAPFSRASWYTRLPGPPGGPWAGVVRCEASGALPTETLTVLADRVTVALGRYASEPHKDARAPQNLYPIAGLERELRRRLGDAGLLYRALRTASTQFAAPVS
jgi:hypothetical protein